MLLWQKVKLTTEFLVIRYQILALATLATNIVTEDKPGFPSSCTSKTFNPVLLFALLSSVLVLPL